MNHGKTGTRLMVAILIAGSFLVAMSSSAEAFWGRHHYWHGFHRHHAFWPSYRSYGFYGNYGYSPFAYGRYSSWYAYPYVNYAPTYYAPTYYAPSYYVPSYYAPAVDCGCCSASTWDGSNDYDSTPATADSRLPAAYAETNDRSLQYEGTTWAALRAPTSNRVQVAATDQRAVRGIIELKIRVPEDARVFVNDRLTTTPGIERTFFARGATTGGEYEFVVRAEVERNGQAQTESKRVVLRAGQASSLAFNLDVDAAQIASVEKPVSTMLKLHVPDNAKVYLAGHEMKQKSGVRVFETTKLRTGEKLNYTVRVAMVGDGELESREKELTLVGGQTQEVEFDFTPSTQLAAR